MRRKLFKVAIWATAVGVIGCSDIVIKVNKKSKSQTQSEESGNLSKEKYAGEEVTPENVYDFLKDQDKIKELAAVALIDQLKNRDFRSKFRKAVRDLRESIVRNAETEHEYGNPLFDAIDDLECSDINKEGIHALAGKKSLGIILKGTLLSKLSSKVAVSLDMNSLDEETLKVISIVLFDMGVTFKNIEGGVIGEAIADSTSVDDLNSQNAGDLVTDENIEDLKKEGPQVSVDGDTRNIEIELGFSSL